MNRERILRIMAALRAKFADNSGCTPEEAEAAMDRYNAMMLKYNVDETELGVKTSGVGFSEFVYSEGKQKHEVYWCLFAIGKLTNTRPITQSGENKVVFFGTQADRDYAEFLFRLCWNAIDTAWTAFRYSWKYTELSRSGIHGKKIRHSFRTAMATRLSQRMKELARQNEVITTGNGNALVVLKHELINAFVEENCGKIRKGNKKKTPLKTADAVIAGVNAADEVRLRQEFQEPNRQLEYSEA